jgi:type I restriction enzyme S subunit
MTQYPKYKNSGDQWLGTIPSHWKTKRLKYVAEVSPSNIDKKSVEGEPVVRLCNYVDVYKNDFITKDLVLMEATASEDQLARFELKEGDVIITKDSEDPSDIAVPAVVKTDLPKVVCGYHLTLIRTHKETLDGFLLFRLFQSYSFNQQFTVKANGVTRYGLPSSAVTDATVPIPSTKEQKVIVSYLDQKTTLIDETIRKKQRLIELLQEERIAQINQAVTVGFDDNVVYKNTNLKWVDKFPSHWTCSKLKYIVKDIVDTEHRTIQFVELSSYKVVRTSDVRDGVLLAEQMRSTTEEGYVEWTRRGTPEAGDILLTREAPAGEACVIPDSLNACLGQRMVLLKRSEEKILSQYLVFIIYSSTTRKFIESLSQGTTVSHLNMSDIRNIPVLLPPLAEQAQILSKLKGIIQDIQKAVRLLEQEISLLNEYRTSLISEVVTGSKCVLSEEELEKVIGRQVEAS